MTTTTTTGPTHDHAPRRRRRPLAGLVIVAPMLAAGLIAFAGTATAEVAPSSVDRQLAAQQSTTYVDPQGRYSIAPPSGWTTQSVDDTQDIVVFVPADGAQVANLTIIAGPSSGMTDAVAAGRAELDQLDGYELKTDRDVTLRDGTPAHIFAGTYKANGNVVRILQVLVPTDVATIVVTGGVLDSQYPTYGPLLEESLMSVSTGTDV